MTDPQPPGRREDSSSEELAAQVDTEFGSPELESGASETEPLVPVIAPERPEEAGPTEDGDRGGARQPVGDRLDDDGDRAERTPAAAVSPPSGAAGAIADVREFAESVGMRIIRRPYEWIRRPWPDDRVIQVAVTTATLLLTTFVMTRVVHFNPFDSRADLVFDNRTPTGGDMGAHVWGPAFLRDYLLPNWQLSGWSMDWYGGLPAYRFYMVVPALAIVIVDRWFAYGVAFKLVVAFGVIAMPFCGWAFGRLARFRYPIPELFAIAAVIFVLNESYSIMGGNLRSTMAGEFSFTIALGLMLLGLGFLARGLEDGTARHLVWAAVFLALACLSHGIVLIYTAVTALVFVICRLYADAWRWFGSRDEAAKQLFRKRLLYAVTIGGLTFLLAAFWVLPFVLNHGFMTDMKYGAEPRTQYDSLWAMYFDQKPPLDVLINTLAIIGLVFAFLRRHVYGVAVGLVMVLAALLIVPAQSSLPVIGLLWNPRLLPWLYLMRFLMMMVGAVEVCVLIYNVARNRRARDDTGVGFRTVAMASTALVVAIVMGFAYQALPFGGRIGDQYAWGPFRSNPGAVDAAGPGWTSYNFQGYEGRDVYPEYHDVVQTMNRLGEDPEHGCGRALWENNSDNGRYGTTMALMLLPFWTDGCIGSMEGLFFEAAGSTPYHFLTVGAASEQSSNPVRELRYTNNDAAVAVDHLQALGVRYLMVSTAAAVAEADAQPELTKIEESGPWRIYEVADSDIVVPLGVQPVVVNERSGDQRECFLELGTSWFQNPQEWAAMPAVGGPESWQRIDVDVDASRVQPVEQELNGCGTPQSPLHRNVHIVQPVQEIEIVELDPIEVSNVEIEQQSVSFDVSEVGVPVLVKVSYFPNWTASGADGPYRIGPNQMVVVPTDTHVEMSFGRSRLDVVSYVLTFLGIALAIFLRVRGDWNFPVLEPAGARSAIPGPAAAEDFENTPFATPAIAAPPPMPVLGPPGEPPPAAGEGSLGERPQPSSEGDREASD